MCEQGACVREEHNAPSTKLLCSQPPAHHWAPTQAGNCVQNAWKSAPNVLRNGQSQSNVLPFPWPAWIVRSAAGGGERNLGQTHENPWFRGGRTNPSPFCASGEGAAIPKLSRVGPGACRWEQECGTERSQHRLQHFRRNLQN